MWTLCSLVYGSTSVINRGTDMGTCKACISTIVSVVGDIDGVSERVGAAVVEGGRGERDSRETRDC